MLIAKTDSVIDAIRRGGMAEEAMYYEALIEMHLAEDAGLMEKEASRGYSTELAKEYVTVLTQERNMAERFASGHPDLIALRSRLKELRSSVQSTMGRSVDTKDQLGNEVETDPATKERRLNVYRRMLLERTTATNTQLKSLDIQFEQTEKEASKIQTFTTREEELRGKKERLKQLYDAVVDRLNEINVVQNLGEETLERFAHARIGSQIWPSLPITGAFSLLLGLMSGGLWSLPVSYTHLRAHETLRYLVCRLLLEKKK